MQLSLVPECLDVDAYLQETPEVDYSHPAIRREAERLYERAGTDVDTIRAAYTFVRDCISHSWDIQSRKVTRSASEVLLGVEGICYAKSNLLAALLRAGGIPTGFCYQRLTLGDTPDTGYCLHALNAVYVASAGKWVRIDARGNKPGVSAEFSLAEEKLAFPVRPHLGEVDYPAIYANPNSKTMDVLRVNTDCLVMYLNRLPDEL
ncbi:transglutaminase-like domain-containing protein [Paenibacillus ginsengarvi]|uniref:Transglutaminase family protein n=1 Tax=Paenibacillus ginsengarvi TaxID=400777 RepID=A0A3B0CI45_9BACL|nr:transglutaminase family protein [Paenibacillus ginsengarvi]RKN83979.1 transglutaminase family protein [Paenibacillus ginsengarvi]